MTAGGRPLVCETRRISRCAGEESSAEGAAREATRSAQLEGLRAAFSGGWTALFRATLTGLSTDAYLCVT